MEYIILQEPIEAIAMLRVDYNCKDRIQNIKREWLKTEYKYYRLEPMLTNKQVDKLINIEWLYNEDV